MCKVLLSVFFSGLMLISMTGCRNKKDNVINHGTSNEYVITDEIVIDHNEIFNWSVVESDFEKAKKEAYEITSATSDFTYNEDQKKELATKMIPLLNYFIENGKSIYKLSDALELYKDSIILYKSALYAEDEYYLAGIYAADGIIALYGGSDDVDYDATTALSSARYEFMKLGFDVE